MIRAEGYDPAGYSADGKTWHGYPVCRYCGTPLGPPGGHDCEGSVQARMAMYAAELESRGYRVIPPQSPDR